MIKDLNISVRLNAQFVMELSLHIQRPEYNVKNAHKHLARSLDSGGGNKMGTLREEAKAYEPPQTLNIADLDKVQIDMELKDGDGIDGKGEAFKYKFVEVEGKEYRIAGTVIGGIKALVEKMPNLKFVSVTKQGQGMATRYQVVPFIE